MITTILWDVDGTLLNFEQAERYAIRKCFSIFDMGECTDEMLSRYTKINASYWRRLERGEITKPEVLIGRFQEFFADERLPVENSKPFNEEYQKRLGDKVFVNDDAIELIRTLKENRKVKQAIVTNGTIVAQHRKLKESTLDQLIDDIFISDEIGAEKPTLGFFDYVWKTLGIANKEEVLIVGDSLTSDIQGGNNAGIKCCWYNPEGLEKNVDVRVDYEIKNLQEIWDILEMKI